MRRSPGVDQRHLVSLQKKMVRGPGAENTSSDDDDVRSHFRLPSSKACSGEGQQLARRNVRNLNSAVGDKSGPNDFRLLLNTIKPERLPDLRSKR